MIRPLKSSPALVLAGVFLVTGALGWALGGAERRVPEPPPADAKIARRDAKAPRRPAMSDSVSARIAAVRAAATPDERIRLAIGLAQSLSPEELLKWYDNDWFTTQGGLEATVFFRVARERLLEADPQGLMELSIRRNSKSRGDVAGEWAKRDPAAALAFLDGLKKATDIHGIVTHVLLGAAKASPELALEGLARFDGGNASQPSRAHPAIAELAKSHPELLKGAMEGWGSEMRKMADVALVGESLKNDFNAGIGELAARPDGLAMLRQLTSVAGKMILASPGSLPDGWLSSLAQNSWNLVDDDPAAWLALDLGSYGVDEAAVRNLRSQALQRLAWKDPAAALDQLDGEDFDKDQRGSVLHQALQSLARKDPDQARAWLAGLSDPQDIGIATQAIEAATQGSDPQAKKSPAELIQMLGSADGNTAPHMSEFTRWTAAEAAQAREEFASLQGPAKDEAAKAMTPHLDNRLDPGLAGEVIRHLIENPATDPGNSSNPLIASASQNAAKWVEEDPRAAADWVSSLPAGEERLWAAKNMALRWADYDPQAATRWANSLPADESAEVEAFVESGGKTER